MMRGRGRLAALELAALTLAALTLSGCSRPPAPTPAQPSPTASPVFASEDEALAAATEAYAAYRAAIDKVAGAGGVDSAPIRPFLTDEYTVEMIEDVRFFQANGYRTTGDTTFDSVRLQSIVDNGKTAEIVVYLCSDTSAIRLFDGSGTDVTIPDRQSRTPLEIHLSSSTEDPQTLQIGGSELWTGENFC